jgi:hypothetical protein
MAYAANIKQWFFKLRKGSAVRQGGRREGRPAPRQVEPVSGAKPNLTVYA